MRGTENRCLPRFILYVKKRILLEHHEKLNGKGYPYGVSGAEIPLEAKIISISDAYHAMISNRPYHKGVATEEAIRRLQQSKGEHFDPELTDLFCEYIMSPAKHTYRFRPFCLVH